jgi:protein SCO1/2
MTFMRVAPGEPWVRIEGFATPEELLKEYLQLVAGR